MPLLLCCFKRKTYTYKGEGRDKVAHVDFEVRQEGREVAGIHIRAGDGDGGVDIQAEHEIRGGVEMDQAGRQIHVETEAEIRCRHGAAVDGIERIGRAILDVNRENAEFALKINPLGERGGRVDLQTRMEVGETKVCTSPTAGGD